MNKTQFCVPPTVDTGWVVSITPRISRRLNPPMCCKVKKIIAKNQYFQQKPIFSAKTNIFSKNQYFQQKPIFSAKTNIFSKICQFFKTKRNSAFFLRTTGWEPQCPGSNPQTSWSWAICLHHLTMALVHLSFCLLVSSYFYTPSSYFLLFLYLSSSFSLILTFPLFLSAYFVMKIWYFWRKPTFFGPSFCWR